jgi:hypothetical protein
MEEAAELGSYLPLSFKTRSEQEYMSLPVGCLRYRGRITAKATSG